MSEIEAERPVRRKGPPKGSHLNLTDEARAARRERNFARIAQQSLRDDHSFWMRRVVTDSGCWEWSGARYVPNRGGYGVLHREHRAIAAHRYAWMLAHGPIPAGLFVCHKCDNPPCFRLSHLFLGTQTDNMRDMSAKGRSKFQKDPDAFRGVNHWAHRHPEIALAKMAYARSLRHVKKDRPT